MNGPPEHVWDFVKPLMGSLREQWDENVTRFEIIQSITDVSLAMWLAPDGNLAMAPVQGVQDTLGQGESSAQPWCPADTRPRAR